jgi:2-(1,2-epoxy-1,2-dihydrophenyl)acetyl-CoA isomerase
MIGLDSDLGNADEYSVYVQSMIGEGVSGTQRPAVTNTWPLRIERNGAVAVLTMNRPDVGNAIDVPLAKALLEAALACDANDSIRSVILTGAGCMFCAGNDREGFARGGNAAPVLRRELTTFLHMAIARFVRMDKPLITAITGAATGAGFGLGILGDIALAARSSHLSVADHTIGRSPDAGTTWLLPRLIGLRRAQDLALTERHVGPEEAVNMGLVTRVCEDDALLEEALRVAKEVTKSTVRGHGRMRELLMTSFEHGLESQMEREARTSIDLEGREGLPAFLDRRPAIHTN